MAKFVLTDQLIFAGSHDYTGDANAVAISHEAELKDCTTFDNSTRVNLGGLKVSQIEASGYYDAATQDATTFTDVGLSNTPVSVAVMSAVGSLGYFMNCTVGQYTVGESVGEINKFSLTAGSQGELVRGVVGYTSRDTATTVSGVGPSLQLGAVATADKLYAVLHVLGNSGTGDQTLDVVVESDNNTGFTSGVNRLVFTQATTANTGELLSLAGPVTDNFFRVNFTIAGTGSPTFNFIVMIGILRDV